MGRPLCVVVVVSPYGRALADTGSCCWLLEEECGFLGHVRRRWCSAPAVADELERRWSRRGLGGPRTGLPGRRPGSVNGP